MPCYKSGGCGVYEGLSCNDCPASKPEYIFRDESPCRECDHGWGSMTSTSIQSCHDTCQELKQWNERRIKFMNYDSNQLFQKELIKLHDEQEKHTNDVGCAISQDCSMMGCYRYIICDFPEKKQ